MVTYISNGDTRIMHTLQELTTGGPGIELGVYRHIHGSRVGILLLKAENAQSGENGILWLYSDTPTIYFKEASDSFYNERAWVFEGHVTIIKQQQKP